MAEVKARLGEMEMPLRSVYGGRQRTNAQLCIAYSIPPAFGVFRGSL